MWELVLLQHAVGIEDEFLGGAFVEVRVALCCLIEWDDGGVDDLGDGKAVVQDSLHELAIVFEDGSLAGVEAVRFSPAEAEPYLEVTGLRGFVDAARIVGDIEAGDADGAGWANDGHEGVEDGGGGLLAVFSLGAGFEADAVDGGIDLGLADDLRDEVAEVISLGEIDGNVSDGLGMFETLGDHVADHDDGGSEDVSGGRSGEPDGACTGDVDDRADAAARVDGSVEAGGEDVREHGEVFDLGHGLIFVGEGNEVEVGVGNEDVFGLAADPSAHIDVAVGSAGAAGIDVEADAGFLRAAGAAASAGDVEGDGDEVAFLDVLDIGADLDDFAGDLVTEDHAGGCGGAATDHVLVGAADVGGDDFEDGAVSDLFSSRILHLGEVDGLDFDFVLSEEDDSAIFCHGGAPYLGA